MKLHLPKALFTAVMALFAVSQTVWGETYNLLSSGDNWDMSAGQEAASRTPVYTDSSTITTTNWGQALAVYSTRGQAYTVGDDGTLEFSVTLQTSNAGNSVLALTLTGSSQTIALGTLDYGVSDISYGLTNDTTSDVYLYNATDTNWASGTEHHFDTTTTGTTDSVTNVGTRTTDAYTLSGKVTLGEDGNYTMDLSLNGTSVAKGVALGSSFDISRITLQADGGNNTLSALTITGSLVSTRYDATVTGTLAAADAVWSMDGTDYTTDQLNLTDGSVNLGLTGSGEGATIVFADGTNVSSLAIAGGSVTLDSTGSLTTGAISVEGDASVGIAEGTTVTLTGTDLSFMASTTGTGTVSVTQNSALAVGSYGFAGVIDVANSMQLNYGADQSNGAVAEDMTVRLNEGSTLYVESFGSKLGVLDVQGDATLRAYDSSGKASVALTIGEVKIAAGKTLGTQTNWEGMMVIESLNAEGDLNSNFNDNSPFFINSIAKSGAISNSNANGTMTLGEDGDSVLNLGGDVTNSGTLNIKGQLAGTSTISGGTINLESTASVSGNITFGSDIHIAGTLSNTGTVTLGGNVTVDDWSVLKTSGELSYSTNDGQDGYITSATFYVVEGSADATATLTGTSTLYEGTTEVGAITADGGSLIVNIQNESEGVWYVNTQDFTVDGAEDNLAKNATGYAVAAGQTLTINANQSSDTMTASTILATTIGEGNIALGTDATIGNNTATQATGKLTINSGKTLKVGEGAGHTSSIASFSSVDLNGGTLRMHNNGSTVNNLTVGSESTLHIQDAANANSTTLLAGTTTLNAELNVTSGFKGTLTVDKLTGTGNLDIDAGDNGYVDTLLVNINKLQNYSGVIGYKASGNSEGTSTKTNNVINIKNTTDNNAYGAINIGGLTLENSGAAFATANLDMGRNDQYGANSLGAVSISGGSVLSMFNRGNDAVVNMSSLTVTGAATVQTKRDDSCFQGIVNIASLANGGDDAATLNLASGSKTTAIMAYNLNGGDGFTGTINVKGDAATGGSRRVALNINAENAAKGAVINFLDATTDAANDADENYTALGLGSNATVAGLGAESVGGAAPVLTTNAVTITGYKIKANEKDQFATRDDADTGTSARTLTINAADSKEYSVKANVGANVNLTQSGAGTQNISGDQSAMNGTLEASAGALNITNTGAAMSLAGVKATGGIVQVSDATNAVTMADMTVSNGGQVKGNGMTVTSSMTISNSDAFDLTGALVMSGATVNLSGFTLDTTTAQDTYVYTLGTAAGGITADASISFTGINVDGYTATLAAMATVPTAGAAMLADDSATNNYLVLTLVKDTVTPPPATELTQVTVTGAQGYDSAGNVLTLTTNIADIADYSGIASTLAATVTDSLWEQLVKQYGIGTLVNIALVDEAGNYFDLDGADNADTGDDVALTINGIGVNTPAPTYSAVGNGAAVGPYVTSYIPEPTTGTLSILALAGLMIRRRRR